MELVNVGLKLSVAHLVSRFIFSVVFGLLLNRIIGQVNHPIRQIKKWKLTTRRSQIALLVIVGFVIAIMTGGHAEGADVKLPTMNQEWIVDVLLDDAGFLGGARIIRNNLLQLMPLFRNLNSHPSVRALARLGYPNIILVGMFFIILLKGYKIWVIETLFDMKSYRQWVEGVLSTRLVVVFHVHKQGLFVAKMVIIFNFVSKFDWIRFKWLFVDFSYSIFFGISLLFFFSLFFLRWSCGHWSNVSGSLCFFSHTHIAASLVVFDADKSHSDIAKSAWLVLLATLPGCCRCNILWRIYLACLWNFLLEWGRRVRRLRSGSWKFSTLDLVRISWSQKGAILSDGHA